MTGEKQTQKEIEGTVELSSPARHGCRTEAAGPVLAAVFR